MTAEMKKSDSVTKHISENCYYVVIKNYSSSLLNSFLDLPAAIITHFFISLEVSRGGSPTLGAINKKSSGLAPRHK